MPIGEPAHDDAEQQRTQRLMTSVTAGTTSGCGFDSARGTTTAARIATPIMPPRITSTRATGENQRGRVTSAD
jgi:hypothetical protein